MDNVKNKTKNNQNNQIYTVTGLQYGDEGKGKMVDYWAKNSDIVARYNGGNNAGHTVAVGNKTYKLNLIPCGILHKEKLNYLGPDTVIDLKGLINEIDTLRKIGTEVNSDNFNISDNAHIICDIHKVLDKALESEKADQNVGTTGRGIGPAYSAAADRIGIRICDLFNKKETEQTFDGKKLKKTIAVLYSKNEKLLKNVSDLQSPEELFNELMSLKKQIKEYVIRYDEFLKKCENKKILIEGAQGALLDAKFGTYPNSTASRTLASAAPASLGIPSEGITNIGVIKAYTTRVGSGSFPTEPKPGDNEGQEFADYLQTKGKEFGVVTGRKRKCGPIDLVALKIVVKNSGIKGIAITKLDILDGLKKIPVCVGYMLDGKKIDYIPSTEEERKLIEPIYEYLPGWEEKTSKITKQTDLPENAVRYVDYISKALGVPIYTISTGADRNQTINVQDIFASENKQNIFTIQKPTKMMHEQRLLDRNKSKSTGGINLS